MQTFQNLLLVGVGGFVGSAMRYLMSGWAQSLFRAHAFPIGTAVVNIVGCLVIGVLGGLSENQPTFSANTRLLLMIGLLGGFTTFSTFGYETLALLRDRELALAFVNVAAQVILGLAAVLVGYNVSKML